MSKFEICIGGCTKIFHTEWVIDDINRMVSIWFKIEYDDDIRANLMQTPTNSKLVWIYFTNNDFE